ncbi:hypothetical protein SM124_23050 [Bacillus sp. 31A1R]|uniref:Uncharacterized protein n=1 Tax=Robertmurraya mangrovi TaxID=3098077 RepID=A0ABU5J577_9BACI|nr:hypothetical protein [Bacillus sp. 31A1R]MDZ5474558.1 hypothetical protein [Bacillus sp. 31A1R]
MKQNVQMILRYEIKTPFLEQYQEVMKEITKMLPTFEANGFQLNQSNHNPNQVIEKINLPTVAHYYALKKLRKSNKHNVFGILDQMISGGLSEMECWALKTKM